MLAPGCNSFVRSFSVDFGLSAYYIWWFGFGCRSIFAPIGLGFLNDGSIKLDPVFKYGCSFKWILSGNQLTIRVFYDLMYLGYTEMVVTKKNQSNLIGRPKVGDYTNPKPVRFDKDVFALLEAEMSEYGSNLSDRIRCILREYYREQGKLNDPM